MVSEGERMNVSLIIPCRDEEKFIGQCLDSVIASDYPADNMEVFVVDGRSEDRTREIVKTYSDKYPFIRLMDNPKKVIPAAMNIGIKYASSDIIMKIDAHTVYKKDYITKCIKFLIEYNADNVGGLQIAVSRNDTLVGKAIVISLSHRFGVGNSYHRLQPSEPMWSDTAYSGCFKKDMLEQIGLYDENIARSEDVAINSRIREAGGKILLVPEIVTHYYARSNLRDFIKHNFDNGIWITYPLKYGRVVFSWRHLIPLIFVSSLIGMALLSFFSPALSWLFLSIIGSYALANFYSSCRIAIHEKNLRYLFIMPLIFALLHIGYGLGSMWGLLRVATSGRFWLTTYNHYRRIAFKGASH